jgi:hypothetical protein
LGHGEGNWCVFLCAACLFVHFLVAGMVI